MNCGIPLYMATLTASVYIYNPFRGVFLIHHKKTGQLLPLGGHIKDHETYIECAKRELREEAYIDGHEFENPHLYFLGHDPGKSDNVSFMLRLMDSSMISPRNEEWEKGVWMKAETIDFYIDLVPSNVRYRVIKIIDTFT